MGLSLSAITAIETNTSQCFFTFGMDDTFAALILNHKGMKALIIISCCLALAFVLSAIERLRLSMNRDNFKLDDPEKLTDSLKEYQGMMD